jgi:hypothetical protein
MHMTNELMARAQPRQASFEDDYQAFCAAFSESARGRAFLAEFARRNRNADTEMLLAALDRLEILMRAEGTALERLRDELRVLLITIKLARPDLDSANPPAQAEKLTGLLDMLERRIDDLAQGKLAEKAPQSEEPEPAPVALSVVEPPEQPELPIPTPQVVQAREIALVRPADAMPEVSFNESALARVIETALAEPVAIEAVAEPAAENFAPAKTAARLPAIDPFAAIMRLSEAERIALFT